MKKKTVALLLAVVAVFGIAVGGSLAWLKSTTSPVVNTFTTSGIEITLTETKNVDPDSGEFSVKMVPGAPIEKDPVVTVQSGSEPCWLFVKVEEANKLDDFITYTVDNGWKQVEEVEGVYYRAVDANNQGIPFSVLKDDLVYVKDSVSKDQMNALTNTTLPTLTFSAYAIQSQYLKDSEGNALTEGDIAEIWQMVQPKTQA